MRKTLHSLRFLVLGPMMLVMLLFVNLATTPHHLWVKWAALGIGIAWLMSLVRVAQAVVLLGGAAALFAWLRNQKNRESAGVASKMD